MQLTVCPGSSDPFYIASLIYKVYSMSKKYWVLPKIKKPKDPSPVF